MSRRYGNGSACRNRVLPGWVVGWVVGSALALGCGGVPAVNTPSAPPPTEPAAAMLAVGSVDDARARLDGHLVSRHADQARAVLEELRQLGADAGLLLLDEARILAVEDNHRGVLRLLGDLAEHPAAVRAELALLQAQALAATDPDALDAVRAALTAGLTVAPEHVGLLLASARLERAEGRWQPAYNALRTARQAAPEAAAPWVELGELELARGRADPALAAFDAALARDTTVVAARLRRTLILLSQGQTDAARAELDRAVAQAGPRVPIVAMQALLATQQGELDRASVLVAQVLAVAPDDAIARYVGAYLELRGGQIESARRKLEALRLARPELAFLDRLYGLTLLETSEQAAGQALLEGYLQTHPDDAEVLEGLRELAQARGLSDDADALRARQLAIAGRGIGLADAERQLTAGDPEGAAATLAPLLETHPDWRAGRRLLAVARLHAGDTAAARDLAEALIAAAPDDALAHQVLGLALRGDDPGAARAAFERAWALAPGEPSLAGQLAELAFARGDIDTAVALYEQVLAVYPGHRPSLSALASLAGAVGDDDARLDYLLEALRFHPQDGEIRLAVAREQLRRGQRGPALVLARRTPTEDGADGWLVRYRIEAAAEDWEAAAESARGLLGIEPESATAWLRLAEAEGRAGRVEGLREALLEALGRSNDDLDGETLLRLALLSGGPDAITATLVLLGERYPEHVAVLDAVGLALLADNQPAEAVAHYGAAHRTRPDEPLWTLRQAAALGHMDRRAQQLAVLESGAMRFGDDARVRVALGDAYAAAGRLPAAQLAWRGAGEQAEALARLARFTAPGDPAAGLDFARRAAALDPSPDRLYALGVLALKNGAADESVAVLRRLLRQRPGHADGRYHLALALHEQGEDAAARRLLEGLLGSPRNFRMRTAASTLYQELAPAVGD